MWISELSTSVRTFQYDLKPEVPNSEGRKLFFDTHAVVRLFEENGLASSVASFYLFWVENLLGFLSSICIFLNINRFHNSAIWGDGESAGEDDQL